MEKLETILYIIFLIALLVSSFMRLVFYIKQKRVYRVKDIKKMGYPEFRLKNFAMLKRLRVPIAYDLPLYSDEESLKLKSPHEIVGRMLAVLIIPHYNKKLEKSKSEEEKKTAKKELSNFITKFNLLSHLTELELEFISNENKDFGSYNRTLVGADFNSNEKHKDKVFTHSLNKKNQIIFGSYSYYPLAYALGHLKVREEVLDPTMNVLDLEPFINYYYKNHNSIEDIVAGSKPQSLEKIRELQDYYYNMLWACNEAAMNRKMIRKLNPFFVMEGFRAATWLIDSSKTWDKMDFSA